jgi:hypothetical protein
MKTAKYVRSDIVSFFELPISEQGKFVDDTDQEQAEQDSYVLDPCDDTNTTYLPLSMFMRLTDSRIKHGVYGQTYFSAYFITISRDGTQATVSYEYQ